jgi:ribosomal protein S24E
MTIVTADVIVKQLHDFCLKYPTRGKAAKALKVTPAQLSQTLNKKNNVIPERILKRLGYKSELVYSTVAPKKPNKRTPKKSPVRAHLDHLSKETGKKADRIVADTIKTIADEPYKAMAKHIYESAATAEKPRVVARPAVLGAGYGKPKDDVIEISVND